MLGGVACLVGGHHGEAVAILGAFVIGHILQFDLPSGSVNGELEGIRPSLEAVHHARVGITGTGGIDQRASGYVFIHAGGGRRAECRQCVVQHKVQGLDV